MPPIMIFYSFVILWAMIAVISIFTTMFLTPWFINPKFRGPLKERLQKMTGYSTSDLCKYGTFARTLSYGQAVVSEKYAQKYFGLSSQKLRSKFNRFEIFLCYVAAISCPLCWILAAIIFIAIQLGVPA